MQHGQKLEEMYETTVPKNEVIYPPISIPAEVFKDVTCKIGEKYTIEITIELTSMDQYSYGGKLLESEIESDEEENE